MSDQIVRVNKRLVGVMLAGVWGLLLPVAVNASPILSTHSIPGTTPISGAPETTGWKFQTGPSGLIVGALDAMLNQGNTTTQVRLYDSTLTVLASATVTTSDPTETAGLTWFTQSISPVSLAANTTYYIVQDDPQNNESFTQTSTPVMSNGATYQNGVSSSGTGGKPTGDALLGGLFSPSYFGANLDPAVPEPASLLAILAGAGAMVCRRPRRA